MKNLLALFLIGILFVNCGKDNDFLTAEEQLEVDTKIIEDYLSANNLTAQKGEFGLYYIIEEEGEGTAMPTRNSEVIIHYKGYFPDGQVFDETGATPRTFALSNTILGWQLGIPLFKKGAKGKLFIPSGLAYGTFGRGSIPGNQVLFFDIELINFL